MCAFRADGLNLSTGIEKQDLGVVETLELDFLLVTGLEVERGDALDLVLGRHSRGRNKRADLPWSGEGCGI